MSLKYLFGAFLIAAGTFAAVLVQPAAAAPTGAGLQTSQVTLDAIETVDAATTVAQIQPAMTAFFNQYGVAFHFDCTGIDTAYYGCAASTDADFVKVKATSQLMLQEWSKYPAILVTTNDLERVYIVGDVRVDINGTGTGSNQARAAVPDTLGKNMIYSNNYAQVPGAYVPTQPGDYFRSVIHHEYAHYVEYGIFGQSSDANRPGWIALNDPSFQYGNGGAACYNAGCPTGEHTVPGFVTGYATSAPVEDYAETFAYMFMTSQYAKLSTWLPGDSVLTNKVAFLKNELVTEVSPTLNDAYFTAIHDYYNVTFAGGTIALPGANNGSGEVEQPAPGAPNTGVKREAQSFSSAWIIVIGATIASALLVAAYLPRKSKN